MGQRFLKPVVLAFYRVVSVDTMRCTSTSPTRFQQRHMQSLVWAEKKWKKFIPIFNQKVKGACYTWVRVILE